MPQKLKVPSYDSLMWPVLRALKSMGDSASHSELLEKVIEQEGIPERVQNIPHTDGHRTKLSYNLRWAKTYLGKVGALERTSRGVWAITPKGRRMTEDDVKRVPARVRRMNSAHPRQAGKKKKQPGIATDSWQDELISVVRSLTPDGFERLCQRILRESGFVKVEVTGRSGDGGIDGFGVLRINLLSFQVYFQSKKWKGSVGAKDIRDFRGAMVGRTNKGLFITTGTFTAEARKEATRDGAPAIDLIDGERLCDILKNLELGVSTKQVERVSVNQEWFSQF